jgi:hypothetical protein
VIDRVATYMTAVLRSDIKCELSVVNIPGMESCNVPSELFYRLQQLTVVFSFIYFTDRYICCYMDVNQCSWLHYIIAFCKKTRHTMYL